MSTTLVLSFPLGRYHATPWDRHVNEGAVDLPPSPWRLLRTLYAVWKIRHPDLPAEVVEPLLADLAEPPLLWVPAHTIAHTRHYYPDAQTGTDRTLDSFAVFGTDDRLAVQWGTDLDPGRRRALEILAGSIPYFGRADSICTATVDNDWNPTGHALWKPLDIADSVDAYTDTATVLTPELPLDVESLLARPAEVRASGRRFPGGSRMVAYGMEQSATRPNRRDRIPRTTTAVTAVRFDLLHNALPPDTDATVYADLLRQAAIKNLGEHAEGTMLGGRGPDGTPMRGARHAHYLPLITDRRLSGLVVWIPGSLNDKEFTALCDVRTLFDYKSRMPVRVSGVGTIDRIAPELVGPATTWRSVTPFTPSRYPKKNRGDWPAFIGDEVRRELELRSQPTDVTVTRIDGPWTAFVRHRPTARLRRDSRQGQAHQPGQFLRLEFTPAVHGPIALGWLSHFGQGLFVPGD